MSAILEAGCLTCRKRQVRCDAFKPTCRRCPKDGLECGGYKGQMRIVQVDPTKTKASRAARRISRLNAAAARQSPSGTALPKQRFAEDRALWTLTDCADYWNSHIIPSVFPAERPFFRPTLGPDINYCAIPKVTLHFIIVAFRTTQAAWLRRDPLTQPDLCHFRGMGLRELPTYLETAGTDPRGIALVSIVMLMMSELLSPGSAWLMHLEAVQRIVTLRGGLSPCIASMSDSVFLLVQFSVIDVLTSTICPTETLAPLLCAEETDQIPNMDFHLFTCASTCPVEVFQAVARTSELRRQQALSRKSTHVGEISQFDKVLNDLHAFDCESWAYRLANLGCAHPLIASSMAPCSSTAGLASVAECFRSAALLYLHLSCSNPADPDTLTQALVASQSLHHEASSLFAKSSDNFDGPLDTQLWKFITWPLVIAAYAWVGWDIINPDIELETLFHRLHRIAKIKGT